MTELVNYAGVFALTSSEALNFVKVMRKRHVVFWSRSERCWNFERANKLLPLISYDQKAVSIVSGDYCPTVFGCGGSSNQYRMQRCLVLMNAQIVRKISELPRNMCNARISTFNADLYLPVPGRTDVCKIATRDSGCRTRASIVCYLWNLWQGEMPEVARRNWISFQSLFLRWVKLTKSEENIWIARAILPCNGNWRIHSRLITDRWYHRVYSREALAVGCYERGSFHAVWLV